MLIYYRFNNFCSFNCDSEFSMNAPGGKVMRRFPDNYVETEEGFDLLNGIESNCIKKKEYLLLLYHNLNAQNSVFLLLISTVILFHVRKMRTVNIRLGVTAL